MKTCLVGPNDVRWRADLARMAHDMYHLPEYVALCGRQEQGEPAAFIAEEGEACFFVPLIFRPLPAHLARAAPGWRDATCPYGYPGPLIGRGSEDFLARAARALRETLAEHRVVSAFLRLHPLLSPPPEPLARLGQVVQHGETVSIDLTLPHEELWRQIRENHRRGIRRCQRLGYRVVIDDWDWYEAFQSIYRETMTRVGADEYYFFDHAYFEDLKTDLGPRLHLAVVLAEGEVAAAGLFFRVGGIVQYHLGGTRGRYLALAPAKLLFYEVSQWARDRGCHHLHLGGGVGGREDSLFRFKAGFSNVRHPFHTWRIVAAEAQYAALLRASGVQEEAVHGFFPAHRLRTPQEMSPKPARAPLGSAFVRGL